MFQAPIFFLLPLNVLPHGRPLPTLPSIHSIHVPEILVLEDPVFACGIPSYGGCALSFDESDHV